MGKTRPILLATFLAACGGVDGGAPDATSDDDPPDAATDQPDAEPACGPVLPGATVVPAGNPIVPGFLEGARVSSTGEVHVLFAAPGGGQAVREWDGAAWVTRTIYTGANGGWGGITFTELDGAPVLLATPSDVTSDSDRLRFWRRLDNGTFATGQRLEAGNAPLESLRARFDAGTGVLSVAVDNQVNTVSHHERNAAGTWSSQQVAFLPAATWTYGVGIGELTDGTAAMAVTSSTGFDLYRRTGASWSFYRNIAGGEVSDASVTFPPDGTAGANAVAMWIDPAEPRHLRGAFVNTTTGTPTGAGDLSQTPYLTARWSQVVFDDTGNAGKVLIVDDNFASPRAWIVAFSGTSFSPPQELRPDLVFEAFPHLLFHPCEGFAIVHASRAPADAAGSQPVRLDPLATFAPGL